MKAKSTNTTALLLKTLLLAGFIIITVMSGMAQTSRYWVGGGTSTSYTDGDNWSITSGGTTKIGNPITWDVNSKMVFDVSSSGEGTAISVTSFPKTLSIGGIEITGSKVVSLAGASTGLNPCTITLAGSSPINIESGSELKINSKGMVINITPATAPVTGNIDGTISTGGQSNTGLTIGLGATITSTAPIYGSNSTLKISTFTVNGTFSTSSDVNCGTFNIESTGIFKTSYVSESTGFWYDVVPSTGNFLGTIEFNKLGVQTLSDHFNFVNLIFSGSGEKSLTGDVYCSGDFTINDNASVIVESTSFLTVDGLLDNNAGASGLVLKSDADGTASLVHYTADVEATVERYIANNFKWHFLSSPVSSQNIWPEFAPAPSGSPLTYGTGPNYNWDFYYYNPNALVASQLYWVNLRKDATGAYNNGTDMLTGSNAGYGSATLISPPKFVTGRGYLTAYNAGWNTATGSPSTHIFSGNLNSGINNVTIYFNSSNTYNLVGNPYPSSIDWDAASGWDKTALFGSGTYTYWIWNDYIGNYGSYGSYTTDGIGTNGATQYIAPGQAFFVKAVSSGSLGMNDEIRINSAQPFLKNTNTETNLVRLKIETAANTYSDEMIVEFNADFTGGGSDKFWSFYTEAPELYSVKDGNNYSIDRYNSLEDDMKVNIAAKTGVDATYTITATNIADFTLRDKVYLLDKKTGVKTNLKQTPSYSFAGTPDDDRNRFQLIFGTSIGVDEETSSDITIYASENIIYIRNDKANEPYTVMVSNMLGQIITRTQLAGNTLNQIELKRVPGVYVVTVYSEGSLFSRKVVVK